MKKARKNTLIMRVCNFISFAIKICHEIPKSPAPFEFDEHPEAKAPFAFNDTLWIGYESERSAMRKVIANYA